MQLHLAAHVAFDKRRVQAEEQREHDRNETAFMHECDAALPENLERGLQFQSKREISFPEDECEQLQVRKDECGDDDEQKTGRGGNPAFGSGKRLFQRDAQVRNPVH